MTLGGWVFMLGSISSVIGLCAYCFRRVLTAPRTPEDLHSPYTIEPEDTRDDARR